VSHRTPLLAAFALVACASGAGGRGRVALRCPDPAAEVEVDGVPYGVAADYSGGDGKQLLLTPGAHRIALRGSAGGRAVREVAVGPEDSISVAFDLPPVQQAEQGGAKATEQVRGGVR
jgi:hypothetical protein